MVGRFKWLHGLLAGVVFSVLGISLGILSNVLWLWLMIAGAVLILASVFFHAIGVAIANQGG